jgi:putative NIF3 family GTP cyclohydrolase 1 type 2
MKTLPAFFVLITVFILPFTLNAQAPKDIKNNSALGIIENIISRTGAGKIPQTVDVIKEGNPATVVKGIATTMFATMDVLKEAVAKNCNLIIVHEPLYYNHTDQTNQFANDPVFLEKGKYINDHNLVIWRFHDYIHSMRPDGIESGMARKLGWEKYEVNGSLEKFRIPETTLEGVLGYLKSVFPKNAFYVIGDPGLKVSVIRFAPGAPGSMTHIRLLEQEDTDVLLAGEAQQWETYEYARDMVSQGKKKAVIFLGHISSEEAGMNYCAEWLKTFITDVPVTYIESGPSYWSY